MPVEIERKFLVSGTSWREQVTDTNHIVDHLIARFATGKARIRICQNAATLTLKGQRRGLARSEYHVDLPSGDAIDMIEEFAVGPGIEKSRHEVMVGGRVWQIDEFHGPLTGLVTADVELPNECYELVIPEWASKEITGDPEYGATKLAEVLSKWPSVAQTQKPTSRL